MSDLRFHVREVSYSRLTNYGEFTLLARMAEDPPPGLSAHLLSPKRADHVSCSRFLDPSAASEILGALNADLPAPLPGNRYVVAGQQAGLLTGPLYTILKAISTISLSRLLTGTSAEEVLPLFWIASEDHDVLEVNRVTLRGTQFVCEYTGEISRGRVPQVGGISLLQARDSILEFVRQTLQETEFTPWIIELLETADYANYATLFRDILKGLFSEWNLRVVDPLAIRRQTSPVLAEFVENWDEVQEAFVAGTAFLRDRGIDPPLSHVGLFEIVDSLRVPVTVGDGRVTLSGKEIPYDVAANQIRTEPERFSPGAALRPVCQDAVLPVIATVAGPTELSYLWQIRPIYEILDIRPSLLIPRISATFLEPGISRIVEKLDLSSEQIFNVEDLLKDGILTQDDAQIVALEEKGAALLEEIDALDYSPVPRWMKTGRDGIASGVTRIVNRLRQERLEQQGIGRKRLERINDTVLPGGKLQERVANVLEFVNLHGPDWIATAIDSLEPFADTHHVVMITG